MADKADQGIDNPTLQKAEPATEGVDTTAPSAAAAPSRSTKTAGNLTSVLAEGSQNNVDNLLRPTTAVPGKPGFDDILKSVRATSALISGGSDGKNLQPTRQEDFSTYKNPEASALSRLESLGRLGGLPNEAPPGGGIATPNLPNPVQAPPGVARAAEGRDTRYANFKNSAPGFGAKPPLPGMQPGTSITRQLPQVVKPVPLTQSAALRTTKINKPQFPILPR